MPLRVTVADYGVGNLHSIRKALEICGAQPHVVRDMRMLLEAECIVFPGVGAFSRAMEKLLPFRDEIVSGLEAGTPALGICIGAQILFNGSDEGGDHGLGYIDGWVLRLRAPKVPHMGWNLVNTVDPLFDSIDQRYFYFAHSYHCEPEEMGVGVGRTEYFGEFASLFRKGNVYGTQFHPEKSSSSGLTLLRNFVEFAEGCL